VRSIEKAAVGATICRPDPVTTPTTVIGTMENVSFQVRTVATAGPRVKAMLAATQAVGSLVSALTELMAASASP
jgi:hypothetical protein